MENWHSIVSMLSFVSVCIHYCTARLICKLNRFFFMTMAKFERWVSSSCLVLVFSVSYFIGWFRRICLPFWQYSWFHNVSLTFYNYSCFIGEFLSLTSLPTISLWEGRSKDVPFVEHNLKFVFRCVLRLSRYVFFYVLNNLKFVFRYCHLFRLLCFSYLETLPLCKRVSVINISSWLFI